MRTWKSMNLPGTAPACYDGPSSINSTNDRVYICDCFLLQARRQGQAASPVERRCFTSRPIVLWEISPIILIVVEGSCSAIETDDDTSAWMESLERSVKTNCVSYYYYYSRPRGIFNNTRIHTVK